MRIEEVLKTSKFRDENHKAVVNLIYTAYWFNDNFNQLLKPYDLTQEQFNVLRILRGSLPKNLTVKEVGGRMIERSSNVPRIVDRLARKGLVFRRSSEVDKRETNLIITEKGLGLLSVMEQQVAKGEKELMGLSEEEAEIFNSLLEKIRNKEDI